MQFDHGTTGCISPASRMQELKLELHTNEGMGKTMEALNSMNPSIFLFK